MRRFPFAPFLAVIVATAGCGEVTEVITSICKENVPDSTIPSTFTGIEGSAYWLGSCGSNYCTLGGQGRVLVYPSGGGTVIQDVHFYETFRIALTPGSYDVVLAFYGAVLDRSVHGVTIAPGSGLKIVRSYWADYDARLLALHFSAGAASQVPAVTTHLGVTEIAATVPPATFPEVRVRLPYRAHPQLTGEHAVADYPGVVLEYRLNPICGPLSWVPESSGGGHDVDWDD